jgi:hypothetical protein
MTDIMQINTKILCNMSDYVYTILKLLSISKDNAQEERNLYYHKDLLVEGPRLAIKHIMAAF